MKPRGRPVSGAIAGFFFGLSIAMLLVLLGVAALDTSLLIVLPLLFLVVGVAWGYFAPLSPQSPQGGPANPNPRSAELGDELF